LARKWSRWKAQQRYRETAAGRQKRNRQSRQPPQKSTGPKSDEGKAKSSLNRLSHGLTSNATIVPGEDPEEFIALLYDLMGEFDPATPTE
jgi:hypothetical protein